MQENHGFLNELDGKPNVINVNSYLKTIDYFRILYNTWKLTFFDPRSLCSDAASPKCKNNNKSIKIAAQRGGQEEKELPLFSPLASHFDRRTFSALATRARGAKWAMNK